MRTEPHKGCCIRIAQWREIYSHGGSQGRHVANILNERELDENSVVKNYFTTAAELVMARAEANQPNMALTSWKGSTLSI